LGSLERIFEAPFKSLGTIWRSPYASQSIVGA
jgi:hypothetical protein